MLKAFDIVFIRMLGGNKFRIPFNLSALQEIPEMDTLADEVWSDVEKSVDSAAAKMTNKNLR